MRLEGIGFGFLIPIYFVVTGMTFDLDSLLTASRALRSRRSSSASCSSRVGRRRSSGSASSARRKTAGLALFGATGLPLIVAIVGIGQERGDISDSVGASLIGAGMISVLVYPFIATRLAGIAAPVGQEADEY